MKTYFRILKFVKPYTGNLILSVLFTIMYALLNGASVYLTIPLLDTLFQESGNADKAVNNTPAATSSFMPDWLNNFIIKNMFVDFDCILGQESFRLSPGLFPGVR